MKKIVSLLLAALLVFALTATAFAEDASEGGKITVTDAVEGITYNAYKVLDLDYSLDDKGAVKAYVYKAEAAWVNFVKAQSAIFAYDEAENIVSLKEGASTDAETIAALAKAALQYATDNSIAAAASATAESDSVVLNVGDLGYYVVDSSLGALCSLDTAMKEVDIAEKNSEPDVEKEEDKASASINETVTYTVTVTIGKGAQDYIVKDKMTDGLTFNNDITATCKGAALTAGTDYTVGSETGYTFIVNIANDYVANLSEGDEIVFTYSAKVNENAVKVEKNTVLVIYGDENETDEKYVEVEYYDFDINKVDGNNAALDGAEFKLYSDSDCKNEVSLISTDDGFRPIVEGETAADCITTTNGTVNVYGLKAGTYYLLETKAPSGYNRDKTAKEVILGEGDDVTASITVVNKSGAELPSTGGIGTTIFYIVGGLCLVGAGVLLVTKKRTQE